MTGHYVIRTVDCPNGRRAQFAGTLQRDGSVLLPNGMRVRRVKSRRVKSR